MRSRFSNSRLLASAALVLGLGACVTVNKTILMDRSAYPVATMDVYVYLDGDEIPSDCQRVALMDAQGDEDVTTEANMIDRLREEAGKLGANALQLRGIRNAGTGERIVSAILDTSAERYGNAIALWCPSRSDGGESGLFR